MTYSTVIDAPNTDQTLLPGMTANITIRVAHADNVLTVPNAALRFKPRLQARTVWVLDAKKELGPRRVTVGITNLRVTAISEGDLREGDVVVIGLNDAGSRSG